MQAVVSCLSSRVVLACACSWWTAHTRPTEHIMLSVDRRMTPERQHLTACKWWTAPPRATAARCAACRQENDFLKGTISPPAGGGPPHPGPSFHVEGVCAAPVGDGQRQLQGAGADRALCPRHCAPAPLVALRCHWRGRVCARLPADDAQAAGELHVGVGVWLHASAVWQAVVTGGEGVAQVADLQTSRKPTCRRKLKVHMASGRRLRHHETHGAGCTVRPPRLCPDTSGSLATAGCPDIIGCLDITCSGLTP